jgi:hypothetical protein
MYLVTQPKVFFLICSNYFPAMFPDAQQLQMPAPGVSPTVNQLTQRTEEATRSDATLYKTPLLRKPWPLEFFFVPHYISPRS